MPDGIKWFFALALLGVAVAGFYWFADQSLLLRVVGLVAVAGVCAAVGLQTEKGRRWWEMAQEARTELRKVVWPTRKETIQSTGLVITMVALVAIILWTFDALLGFLMEWFLGTGS